MTSTLDHVDDARAHGLELLEDEQSPPLGAVMCLSAHQAAFCAVVEPALMRHGTARGDLKGLHSLSEELGRVLRVLERVSSGESAASGVDLSLLRLRAAELTRRAGAVEVRLLDRLAARLTDAEAEQLVARYERVLHRGPTRPHGSNPHNRVLRRVNAWRDHVLDVMDARLAPLERPVVPHVVTGRERRGQADPRRPG